VTPTEFLTARYDERETVARRAYSQGAWRSGSTYGMFVSVEAQSWTVVSGEWERSDADHIALNDPAYILADIAAKRAILALHAPKDRQPWGIGNGWQECVVCFDPGTEAGEYTWETWPCPTLRALVQPYAEHPDFDPTWRVS